MSELTTIPPTRPSLPARLSGGLFLGLAGFQAALAAGLPWGAAAWGGGQPGQLPVGYRLASAASAAVWLVVATGVGGARLGPRGRHRLLTVLLVLMALSALMNAASRSQLERVIWTPFAVLQLTLLWSARRREAAR